MKTEAEAQQALLCLYNSNVHLCNFFRLHYQYDENTQEWILVFEQVKTEIQSHMLMAHLSAMSLSKQYEVYHEEEKSGGFAVILS